ncbi:glycosyltransferase [Microbacterium oleivorans]|uniref:glycosyltransferase n=1 Tax=Microbacterium oleivorans TaxID=273677 RepID=UPI00203ED237|nr:glycosyltransferase [Microbacterium oleivorans]MCM3697090.1 glycosyltransferase [Microbacterium oleivorans]
MEATVRVTADPDISFVVPLYNAAPWVGQCVQSLLTQTATSLEVVCVDDGSTDDSLAIVERIRETDERVTILRQPNAGQSVARNRGLDASRGRYIAFVDSDDYWVSDVASELVARADSGSLDVLLFDGMATRDGDIDDALWSWYSTYYDRTSSYRRVRPGLRVAARMRRRGDYKPHVGLYLSNRAHLVHSGARFIPGIVHQDNPFTFDLLLSAERVAHTRTQVYARRLRPGSTITALNTTRSVEGYLIAHAHMLGALEAVSSAVSRRDRRALTDIVAHTFRGAERQLAKLGADDRRRVIDTLRQRGVPFADEADRRTR